MWFRRFCLCGLVYSAQAAPAGRPAAQIEPIEATSSARALNDIDESNVSASDVLGNFSGTTACITEETKDKPTMTASGWSLQDFSGWNNLGGSNSCLSTSFHGYADYDLVATLSKTLTGDGIATLTFGNCHTNGKTNVYLDGTKMASADPYTNSETATFDYTDGALLELKDEEGNAVISVTSLQICPKSTKCVDLSHVWLYEGPYGSSGRTVLTQNGCAGQSDAGWTYTIQGSVATINVNRWNPPTGTVSNDGEKIIWSNGYVYMRSYECVDLSHEWVYERPSSGKTTLTQNGCSGQSDLGWNYTVQGSIATIDVYGITGTLSNDGKTIIWSNGYVYLRFATTTLSTRTNETDGNDSNESALEMSLEMSNSTTRTNDTNESSTGDSQSDSLWSSASSGQNPYGHANCPCLGELPESTPEIECSYDWAFKGKCIIATNLDSSFKAYPGDYGATCKKHLEPGQEGCFNITTSPPEEKDATDQKDWCSKRWCYVDPCNCDKADVTKSDYFPSTMRYSYETCGAVNTYSEDVGSSNKVGDVKCTIRGATAKSAKCRIQRSDVFREKQPVCSEPAATVNQNTISRLNFQTVSARPSRFSKDETYGHDKWYPASGVCKLPGDPKSIDRSGYLWLPGPVKEGSPRGGTCREQPSCGGVPTTEYYPEDAAMSILFRHDVVGTSFCCGSTDFDTWNLCDSMSYKGPEYAGYFPSHKWTSKTQPYTISGCKDLYEYETNCSAQNLSMPAENCPVYEYHSVMHTPFVESSYALFVSWILFLCLTCVCAVGTVAAKRKTEAAGELAATGALLSFLLFLGCLFGWTGVMVNYWDGCWGEWDPNRVVDAGNLLHGVSENSFRANCWPPLKGTQCSPNCYTYFVQKPGKGLKCGGVVYDFVDNDDPLVCMPPCKAKILGAGHIPEMLPFAQTYSEVEIHCDSENGFVRTDGGTGSGIAMCNKDEKGGLDGPWVHDIMCREGKNCKKALLDDEIYSGAPMAFDTLDGLKCEEIEADEPGMPPSYKCILPAVSHMCALPMRCAANHVPKDPNQDPLAYCHDGSWEMRNPCILEIFGLESALMEGFFWITVGAIPICAFIGFCAGPWTFWSFVDAGFFWRLLGALIGMCLGGVGIFTLVLLIFFIIVFIFSLPLVVFITIAFGATFFVAKRSKTYHARITDEEEIDEEEIKNGAELAYQKIKKFFSRVYHIMYHTMFHTLPGRAIVRAAYSAPLRAAFLFIRWCLDTFLIGTTIDYLFVPETPINFDFPLGIADLNVNLSALMDMFTKLAKFMDFINIKNILQLDFRCDGLVVLFGSFVLLAVEVFVLVFGAFDYLGFHKLTEALCETNLHGPKKFIYKRTLEFLGNVSNYGIQFCILIAQRRVGDVHRTHIYGKCPLEKATFALIYGRCSAGLIVFIGFTLWALLINGHITPRNILKKAGKGDPISYTVPPMEKEKVSGDARLDDVRLPLKFMFVWQSSWGIWTPFSCAGYRLSSRIHVYTGLLFSDEPEEVRKCKAEELARNCKLHVVLAKATGKLVSLCWQVIPFIGIFISKISLYLNEDPNPLLVRDEVLRDEIGLLSESDWFAKYVFQGLKCALNDLLLFVMMMGVFLGGSQPVTLAFWSCIAKAYLEKFQDVLEWYQQQKDVSQVYDEGALKEGIADRAVEEGGNKLQEGAIHAEKNRKKGSKKKSKKGAWEGVREQF